MNPHQVVITGLGLVTSIGNNRHEVLASLQSGTSGIDIHPQLETDLSPVRLAGRIKGFEFPSIHPQSWQWPEGTVIPREELTLLCPHGVYARVALDEAIAHAGWSEEHLRNEETGLLTATGGSQFLNVLSTQKVLQHGPLRVNPGNIVAALPGGITYALNAAYGMRGASGGIVSACASSAQALGLAFDQIRTGKQQRMVVVGAEECDMYSILPFASLRALTLSRDPTSSPCAFDTARDGFALTGGAAVILLETAELARQRGARPLAEMIGWGWSSDGYSPTAPEPEGRGIERAMQQALQQAGISPAEVDYINAHATSTLAGDRAEALALTRLFSGATPWISSTKSQTGHALSMAGSLETALCVLAMKNHLVPQNQNLRNPDSVAAKLRLATRPEHAPLKHVLSNSSGFGGVNVSLLLRSAG